MARAQYKQDVIDYYHMLKESTPCADCGGMFRHYQMDYDHVEGTGSNIRVSRYAKYSKARLDEEIAKCELVCANCHRERTWSRKQYGNG